MGKIVIPKNSASLDEVMGAMQIYYDHNDWLSNADYIKEFKNRIGVLGDDTDSSAYTKKTEIGSYYGFIEWEDINRTQSMRRITARGRRFLEHYVSNDIDAMYEDIMCSLEEITFGRNNFACRSCDSDIEPPALFFRALLLLGQITNTEYAYLVYRMEYDGKHFTDTVEEIKQFRNEDKRIELPEDARKFADPKPILMLKRWGVLAVGTNGSSLIAPSFYEKYETRIRNLKIYNVDKDLNISGSSTEAVVTTKDMVSDYTENEKKFRKWMATQKSHKGTLCTPSMISNNCGALNKVCQLMEIVEYPDLESIFQITNVDLFNDIKTIIKGHPDYDDVDKACSNRYLSTALKWYSRYLDEMYTTIPEIEKETFELYDKSQFLNDVFMTDEQYEKLKRLLFYKRNIILQGAPGVGKTYLAKRFAYSILEEKNDKYIEIVQFHQNYSYEDFIMGYKPVDEGFELKKGIFYTFCKRAESEPSKNFFFIIDEINRGNLSKIFGELMMLVEGDKRGSENKIKLAYKNELFSVPENLYIIGMMNTADRSLAMMDYALRRRFLFVDVDPAFDKPSFKLHLKTYVGTDIADKVVSRLSDLNKKIADENSSGLGKGYCIGHSYFCVPPIEGQSDEEWYDAIMEYEISPLLYEYWWDDKSKAEDCMKELMK